MSLVNNDAAILLREADLSGTGLLASLDDLMGNEQKRAMMSKRARAIGEPYATDKLVQVMLDEMKKKKKSK